MHCVCPIAAIGFAILYALAFGLFIIGTFGLFGQSLRTAVRHLSDASRLALEPNARCLP
jgi:hypothetical protein